MPTALRRGAPVFVTADLDRACAHYRRLGFDVSAHVAGAEYAVARRDVVELHLTSVAAVDCSTNTCCAYLVVDDAWALHREWSEAGVEGRLVAPVPTDHATDEGAYVDPDGNLLRFASPRSAETSPV